MGNLIECGERTVQTKDRICIHDIAKKYDIKPGDNVIVDIRIPASSEDVGKKLANEWNSSKLLVMNLTSTLDLAIRTLEDYKAGKYSDKEREKAFTKTQKLLKLCSSNTRNHFSISDKEYAKFKKSEYDNIFSEE